MAGLPTQWASGATAAAGYWRQITAAAPTANIMGTHAEPAVGFIGGFGVRTMPTGGTTAIYTFAIPYDYAGGDVLVRGWYRHHDQVGTTKIDFAVIRLKANGQVDSAAFTAPPIPASPGFFPRNWTMHAGTFQPGDIIWVSITRYGDDPADTNGRLDLIAAAAEYQAKQ